MDGAELPVADLPVVDIAPLLQAVDNSARRSSANNIAAACASHGAFYAVNSGINGEQRQRAFDAGTAFFRQCDAAKMAVAADPVAASRGFARGFIGIGGESGSAELREVKEGYSYGFDWPAEQLPDNPLQGPNEWPESDPQGGFDGQNFRISLNDIYSACYRVSQTIAAGLAEALQEPALFDACQGTGGETISLMRMFQYLPYANDPTVYCEGGGTPAEVAQRIGSSPHTDWGFLTLVMQQDIVPGGGGLEIWDHTSEQRGWLRVPPVADSLVVNVGDYLSLLTGGMFVSPLHRVTMPDTTCDEDAERTGAARQRGACADDSTRLSLVFFAYPEYSTLLSLAQPEEAMRTSLLQQQQVGAQGQTAAEAAARLADTPFGGDNSHLLDVAFLPKRISNRSTPLPPSASSTRFVLCTGERSIDVWINGDKTPSKIRGSQSQCQVTKLNDPDWWPTAKMRWRASLTSGIRPNDRYQWLYLWCELTKVDHLVLS